jgi:hypothetical protein
MSTGCGENSFVEDVYRQDEILHIQKGHYYGHPNKKRASYFNDSRQCIWYGSDMMDSTAEYTAPMATFWSSLDGIIEFHR